MPRQIVILEDNADRREVMRACLADRFYTFDPHFFDDSSEMIRFLETYLADTILIALDNDLDLKPGPDGKLLDPGSGCHVAEFLATKEPVCPVIIHSTNSRAAETMQRTLRDSGWKVRRVVPFDDVEWIRSDWFFAVRRALVGPISKPQPQPESP